MASLDKGVLRERARECGVPSHDIEGLLLHIVDGIEPGGFLCAVLDNDLREAFGRADAENTDCMVNIVTFLYNYAPSGCWGSPQMAADWRKHRQGVTLPGDPGTPEHQERP